MLMQIGYLGIQMFGYAPYRPNELISSIPSNGFSLIVKFENLPWQSLDEIEELDSVVYVLHAGRNKVKLFVLDVNEIHKIFKDLKRSGLESKNIVIDRCAFLDYFRLKDKLMHTKGNKRGESK